MSPDEEVGKQVEFRRDTENEPGAEGQPGAGKHVLKRILKKEGDGPPHVEFFTEADVDGFPTDKPRWVAFCPDCGSKLALEEHEACPFFGGREVDENGFTVAVQCELPEEDK